MDEVASLFKLFEQEKASLDERKKEFEDRKEELKKELRSVNKRREELEAEVSSIRAELRSKAELIETLQEAQQEHERQMKEKESEIEELKKYRQHQEHESIPLVSPGNSSGTSSTSTYEQGKAHSNKRNVHPDDTPAPNHQLLSFSANDDDEERRGGKGGSKGPLPEMPPPKRPRLSKVEDSPSPSPSSSSSWEAEDAVRAIANSLYTYVLFLVLHSSHSRGKKST